MFVGWLKEEAKVEPNLHEYRDFEDDISEFKKAAKSNDVIKMQQLLHTKNKRGIADVFEEDWVTASMVIAAPALSKHCFISYLKDYLPSPNKKKYTAEEYVLIENLLCRIGSQYFNVGSDELKSKLNEYYRKAFKIIKDAKQTLIELSDIDEDKITAISTVTNNEKLNKIS